MHASTEVALYLLDSDPFSATGGEEILTVHRGNIPCLRVSLYYWSVSF